MNIGDAFENDGFIDLIRNPELTDEQYEELCNKEYSIVLTDNEWRKTVAAVVKFQIIMINMGEEADLELNETMMKVINQAAEKGLSSGRYVRVD